MIDIGHGVTIELALVCEDLRPEPNGKWTILGAFSGDIVVSQVPASIKIALYLSVKVSTAYKGEIFIRYRLDDTILAILKGKLDTVPNYLALPIEGIILNFETIGRVYFEASFDDENWTILAEKKLL